ncbi:hypothetical protein STAB901_01990 [Streptococcus pyogenes STAB901]|nr:hypothetical protein STAB901_01990 [Streptococcus pyogenes STAB901]
MKTKSKRFLNLATLCLALLGTTLLMARPVKAEGPERDRVEDQERENPYQKGLRDGNKAGYEQGKQDRQQNKMYPQMLLLPLQIEIKLKYLSLGITLMIRMMISRDTKMAGILRTSLLILMAGILLKGQIIQKTLMIKVKSENLMTHHRMMEDIKVQ